MQTKNQLGLCEVPGCFHKVIKKGVCSDHLCQKHPRARIRDYSAKPSLPPRPQLPHGLLGLELEFSARTYAVRDRCSCLGVCCHDASVSGGEVKLVRACEKAAKAGATLAQRLAACGARANASCGFHIHIDALRVDTFRVRDTIRALIRCENDWFDIVPPSRRDNCYVDRYHIPNSSINSTRLSDFQRPYWVCFRAHLQTIEIRLHSGTLHPVKVAGWTEVANQLGDVMRSSVEIPDFISPRHNMFRGLAREYLDARLLAGGQLILPGQPLEQLSDPDNEIAHNYREEHEDY